MIPLSCLPALFLLPVLSSAQTITHISQIIAITDLPCLSQPLILAFTGLRSANCPQPSPLSYGSCLCLQSTNVESMSSEMSFWGSLACADRSSVDSSMAMGIFSSYCDLAARDVVVAATTSTPSTSTKHATDALVSTNIQASTAATATPLATATSVSKKVDAASTTDSTTSTRESSSGNSTTTINTSNGDGMSRTDTILLVALLPLASLFVAIAGVIIPWRSGRKHRRNETKAARPVSGFGGAVQDLRRGYSEALRPILHGNSQEPPTLHSQELPAWQTART